MSSMNYHGTRLIFHPVEGKWSVRDAETGKPVEVMREIRLAIADQLARDAWAEQGQVERRRERYSEPGAKP